MKPHRVFSLPHVITNEFVKASLYKHTPSPSEVNSTLVIYPLLHIGHWILCILKWFRCRISSTLDVTADDILWQKDGWRQTRQWWWWIGPVLYRWRYDTKKQVQQLFDSVSDSVHLAFFKYCLNVSFSMHGFNEWWILKIECIV